MDRRIFLGSGITIAGGLVLSPILGCRGSSIADKTDADLAEVTIDTIRGWFERGEISIPQLTHLYLERIRTIDQSGPNLNSIIYVNPDAMEDATYLEKDKEAVRGPLYGIPVLLKDNIDTADMPTTAGSRVLDGSIPPSDASIVKRLREAGAVILGKANLSEWANFRGQNSTSGWSGLGGLTKNPYKLDRNTCGSSAGSGAAASANLCVVAIGTETNGSIVCPSSANGIVGIKPTVGLVSRSGIIPISSTQDTAGPMARTVRDAVYCLSVIEGGDPADLATSGAPKEKRNYIDRLRTDGLNGKRLAYFNIESQYEESENKAIVDPVFKLMANAIDDMRAQGAEVIDITQISDPQVFQDSFEIMLYEYKDGLNAYFAALGDNTPVKTIDQLIEWNRQDSVELRYFGQEYLEMAAQKAGLDDDAYTTARERMLKGRREHGIDRVMKEHQLDAIMAPTGTPAWPSDLENGDSFHYGSSSPAAQAGYPNICVPMGFIDGLPVGISIFGTAWSEPVLIEIAYAYEQATLHRQAPKFLT